MAFAVKSRNFRRTTPRRLTPARWVYPQKRGFNVLALANLAGWYDVSQAAGVTTGTGGISSLNDLSGNARHLTQGTSSKRPALSAAAQNGLDCASFDSVDDFLEASFSLAQPITVYCAVKHANQMAYGYLLDGYAVNDSLSLYYGNSNSSNLFAYSGVAIGPESGVANGTFSIVTAVFNGASSLLQRNELTAVTGNAGTRTPNGLILGKYRAAASEFGLVTVGELIVRSAADDAATRTAHIKYLRNKWGV